MRIAPSPRRIAGVLLSALATTAHAEGVLPSQAPDDLVAVVHFDTAKRTIERLDAASLAYHRTFVVLPRIVRLQSAASTDWSDVRIEFDPAVDLDTARTAVEAAIGGLGDVLRAETTRTVVRWQRGMLTDGSGPPRDPGVLNVVVDAPGVSAEALRAGATGRLAPQLEALAGVRRVRCGARTGQAFCRIEPDGWIDDASTERAVRAALDDARTAFPLASTAVTRAVGSTGYVRVP